jgi:hypothetical protein
MDFAGAVTAAVAHAFVEAGAGAIFVLEQVPPSLTAETATVWASRPAILDLHPAVITTAGDVSGNVDLKQLNKLWEEIRC